MKINLQSKNIDLTTPIHNYVVKRITNLEKLLSKIEQGSGEIIVSFEVSRSTNHHKTGDVFHSDCLIRIDGKEFYSSADKEDLREAIDSVKDNLYTEISKTKKKEQTLFKRGAKSTAGRRFSQRFST